VVTLESAALCAFYSSRPVIRGLCAVRHEEGVRVVVGALSWRNPSFS
jgi:hypothetical protein